ncbi:phosphofurin acidic cluster sorting protein 1-like isoform X1 [Biomphalaria glabrata]|uniref:Phosphofurin acidic cluster sorting protein 1-like isoform X1 n=1 Tax=Biomphalaria glabrata TaxID=6526 RepID=A0A2C9KDF8_BIOGL|nr:phosphofurin acidic cluster sorting protein 1-like isoform X1 [Biomphalaria glabrata]
MNKVVNMADKAVRSIGSGDQPVPMKLFATWEVEKSSPNCIPRLCSLTLTRLIVLKPLETELTSLLIAVKMQNSKRILRSNEIRVPPGGLLDTDLDLSFSLQYPHFLKRDGNKLHVMLQRRKKYKNRTFLGFKTLAVGQVNMSQVLQCSMDRELNLYSDVKDQTNPVAKLVLLGLTSQPVDHEINGHRKNASSDVDRSPDIDNDSDDDDVPEYNDDSSNEDLSDSEPTMTEPRARQRKHSRSKARPAVTQRNIKQKFRALLRRFKISEDVLTTLDSEADHDQIPNTQELDDLFDELEDSDSGPELDTMSVMSTPKPKLKPFFAGRGSTPESNEQPKSSSQEVFRIPEETPVKRSDSDLHTFRQSDLEYEASDSQNASTNESSPRQHSPRPKKKELIKDRIRSTSYREKKSRKEFKQHRRNSVGEVGSLYPPVSVVPRKALLDQLSSVFDSVDDHLPESIFMINTSEWQGQMLQQKLQDRQLRLICTCTEADVKAAICYLVTKIQKFCNSNARTIAPIKVGIVGADAYINSVLRPYVEHFSNKSPDWQNFARFLVIPFGHSSVGKYIASVDSTYGSLFLDQQWKDTFEKPESPKLDCQDIMNRISKYLNGATGTHQMPIAEALIMCKGRSSDEVSSQMFIPFLSEVRIGTLDTFNSSVEYDDSLPPVGLSSSPPASTPVLEKTKDGHTPPSSPNIGAATSVMSPPASNSGTAITTLSSPAEFMDLQVDYWVVSPPKSDALDKDKKDKKDVNKCSLKTAFRALYANRLPHSGGIQSATFSLMVVTKEKKQKIMRIGKKGKELESKSQAIEGVSRMVCTSKSQNVKLRVLVDGVEWNGVKFFQLSSQWQTHIKYFPVAVFTTLDL